MDTATGAPVHGAVRKRPRRSRRARAVMVTSLLALLAAACSWIPFDFDGDKKADYAWVEGPAFETWRRAGQATPIFTAPAVPPGSPSGAKYLPVAGDYDGNGFWEPAVVLHPGGQTWITSGSRGTVDFPAPPIPTVTPEPTPALAVVPVPADYDGDGKTDPAWYRESDATWWIEGRAPIAFGVPWHAGYLGYDLPVPADYDGDRKADLAMYSPTPATWTIQRSSDGATQSIQLGDPGDVPAPADYDGDGRAEPATFGINDRTWHITGREPFTQSPPNDGSPNNGRWPAPANYDGSPGDEPAEVEITSGSWWSAGLPTVELGPAGLSEIRWPVAAKAGTWISALRLTYITMCQGPYHGPCSNI